MLTLTEEDFATLRRLDKAGTPCEYHGSYDWEVNGDGRDICTVGSYEISDGGSFARSGEEHDAALIVAARNALPALLDECERLRAAAFRRESELREQILRELRAKVPDGQ